MAAVIILCFSLTIFSILTIYSYESSKIEQQTSLNNATDSALHAIQLDKKYNKDNYEELANDLLQNIILQSEANGVLNVKILEVNTKEGLLDVLVNKQYYWLGTKKTIETRRTVVLEEIDDPTNFAEPVTVYFKYNDGTNLITAKEESTYEMMILKRPKQPKKQGYKFVGWSYVENGSIISNEDWQDFTIPLHNESGTPIVTDGDGNYTLTFYAVFESN